MPEVGRWRRVVRQPSAVSLLQLSLVEIKAFSPASHTSTSTLSLQIYGVGSIKGNQCTRTKHQSSCLSESGRTLTRSRDLSPFLLYRSENDKYSFSGRKNLLNTACAYREKRKFLNVILSYQLLKEK